MSYLLLENGDRLLLEGTGALLLEIVDAALPVVIDPNPFAGGGGSLTGGVSRARRKQWEQQITRSLKAPSRTAAKAASEPAPAKQPRVTIESVIRELRIPEYKKREFVREWKEELILPSIRAIAVASALSSVAAVGSFVVETGSAALVAGEMSVADEGEITASGIQNPTDEELIQLLFQ